MKKLVIFFICIAGLSLNIAAEEQQKTEKIQSYSEQELNFLKEQYNQLTNTNAGIINDLKEERKNHQDFVESIYRRALVIIGLVAAILTFLGCRTFKEAEKKLQGKIDKELNSLLEKLAEEFNMKPEALKEAIKEKTVEMTLKKDYPIIVLYDNNEIDNAGKMNDLLKSFEFKNIRKVDRNTYNGTFSEKDIVILFSKIDHNDELKDKIRKSKCAILGYGTVKKDDIKDHVTDQDSINFCNSFATLYQNLISLLHYKQYLNG
jgi:hypothetical protein